MDEFLGMGIAYLGLTVDEFSEMRLGHFYTALNCWFNHEKDKQRFTADIIRMQTADLLNIQLRKQDRIKSPDQLWKFPWDEDYEQKPKTDEEIARYNEEIMRKFQK